VARYRKIVLPECDVVGTARDGQSALEAAEHCKPDIIVMDISMPRLSGVEVCRRLRKTLSLARVILVSVHGDAAYVTGAFQAGASAYVSKDQAAAELLCAIQNVLHGQIYLTPSLRGRFWDDQAAGPERLATLTDRQRQLVTLIGKGLTTKEIAAAMDIAFNTAVRRRTSAMRRLGIAQVIDLVRYAIRCRLPAQ
jgi:DNA-binding NarL/FixJ family response regulator